MELGTLENGLEVRRDAAWRAVVLSRPSTTILREAIRHGVKPAPFRFLDIAPIPPKEDADRPEFPRA
jgi:hypothetical protein